ncbi:MAG: flavin reductase [Deltaproteobacteria bacterium]
MKKIADIAEFHKISWNDLNFNSIRLIEDWMLITAGVPDDFNMMTANWGTFGWLWHKPISTIFIRPHRFTHQFSEREEFYSLSFFENKYRDILQLMGEVSGRDFDKMNFEKLQPILTLNGTVTFNESYLTIECRKLFSAQLRENDFLDERIISRNYPGKDFHTMYIGEITNIWQKRN